MSASTFIPPQYVHTPAWVLFNPGIPDGAARFYVMLKGTAWKTGGMATPWLSMQEIQDLTGRRHTAIYKYLKLLCGLAGLAFETAPDGTYRFTFDESLHNSAKTEYESKAQRTQKIRKSIRKSSSLNALHSANTESESDSHSANAENESGIHSANAENEGAIHSANAERKDGKTREKRAALNALHSANAESLLSSPSSTTSFKNGFKDLRRRSNFENFEIRKTKERIPRTPLEASTDPDIQVFRHACGAFPAISAYRAVIDTVRLLREMKNFSSDDDLVGFLKPYAHNWGTRINRSGNQYDPGSATWLVEWAVNERIPRPAKPRETTDLDFDAILGVPCNG